MGDPCAQAETIQEVRKEVSEVVRALQVVAVQKNEIKHLMEHQRDHRDWLKNHEERLQEIEKKEVNLDNSLGSIKDHEKRIKGLEGKPGEAAVKWYWLVAGGVVGIVATVTGKLIIAAMSGVTT